MESVCDVFREKTGEVDIGKRDYRHLKQGLDS
jgi:hypothetical protein